MEQKHPRLKILLRVTQPICGHKPRSFESRDFAHSPQSPCRSSPSLNFHSTSLPFYPPFPSCCYCSVAKSCLTLRDPVNCSTPGFPVYHQLPELAQNRWSSLWCHPTISSSVIPFSSCLQSFPASGSFLSSQFFASGGQSIGQSIWEIAEPETPKLFLGVC